MLWQEPEGREHVPVHFQSLICVFVARGEFHPTEVTAHRNCKATALLGLLCALIWNKVQGKEPGGL